MPVRRAGAARSGPAGGGRPRRPFNRRDRAGRPAPCRRRPQGPRPRRERRAPARLAREAVGMCSSGRGGHRRPVGVRRRRRRPRAGRVAWHRGADGRNTAGRGLAVPTAGGGHAVGTPGPAAAAVVVDHVSPAGCGGGVLAGVAGRGKRPGSRRAGGQLPPRRRARRGVRRGAGRRGLVPGAEARRLPRRRHRRNRRRHVPHVRRVAAASGRLHEVPVGGVRVAGRRSLGSPACWHCCTSSHRWLPWPVRGSGGSATRPGSPGEWSSVVVSGHACGRTRSPTRCRWSR